MLSKLENIKFSNSVRRMAQGVLVLGLAVLTLTAVTFKQRGVVKNLNINLEDNKSEHLIDVSYLKNILIDEYGSDLLGMPIEYIDIHEIERLFNKDAYVKNAEVFVNKNDVLEVQVEERHPIMRIIDPERSYYLDDKGVSVPLSSQYAARLPIVFVEQTERSALTENQRADLVYLFERINQSSFAAALIDQIELIDKNEYDVIPLLGKEKIRLGNTEDLDDKLERLKLFYKKKLAKGHWNQCKYIDVRFKGQIVCGQNKSNI